MVFRNKINRIEFIKASTFLSLNFYLGSLGCHILTDVPRDSKLDSYGGWQLKKFTKTGFFRTQHDEKRWWLVTPEGNAFLSFGINHYHEEWWFQDYNKIMRLETFNS